MRGGWARAGMEGPQHPHRAAGGLPCTSAGVCRTAPARGGRPCVTLTGHKATCAHETFSGAGVQARRGGPANLSCPMHVPQNFGAQEAGAGRKVEGGPLRPAATAAWLPGKDVARQLHQAAPLMGRQRRRHNACRQFRAARFRFLRAPCPWGRAARGARPYPQTARPPPASMRWAHCTCWQVQLAAGWHIKTNSMQKRRGSVGPREAAARGGSGPLEASGRPVHAWEPGGIDRGAHQIGANQFSTNGCAPVRGRLGSTRQAASAPWECTATGAHAQRRRRTPAVEGLLYL
jgi:hypothetical protein